MYIKHSAEGSTWTKKNHKYIRKEGNRYIYPKEATVDSRKDDPRWTESGRYTDKHGRKHKYLKAVYIDDTDRENVKKYDEKIIYDRDQSDRRAKTSSSEAKREQIKFKKDLDKTNRNRKNAVNSQSSTVQDYKEYSKSKANEAKRKAAAGSPNEYVRNQEHAKKMTKIMHEPSINPIKYKNGIGPSLDSLHRRINAMKKQGTVNRQQESKEFKEYKDWEKADAKKRSSAPKRKEALNKQGSKSYKYDSELYGIRDKNGKSGVNSQVSQQDAKEMSRIHRNTTYQTALRESNKENNNTINKVKSKGRKAVDKLLGRFKKKTVKPIATKQIEMKPISVKKITIK